MNEEQIKSYYEYRGMKWPDALSALLFAVTEVGEAVDAYIRTRHNEGWVRNNQSKDETANLGFELGDCYQMLQIASLEATGKTLEENLWAKWKTKGFTLLEDFEENAL